jgi:transcriptional regulator with XRE-family HTH domain|tara:strand:- start:203 stop:535 length:333 start_codon:yes stop_codon:yes gene_type:complete
MATHSKATDAASKANRKRGGLMIKSLRNQMGYTQRELASKCELDYYTFISQIEAGVGKIPPSKLRIFAESLGVNPALFAREILKYYDPVMFEILFDSSPDEPTDYKTIKE